MYVIMQMLYLIAQTYNYAGNVIDIGRSHHCQVQNVTLHVSSLLSWSNTLCLFAFCFQVLISTLNLYPFIYMLWFVDKVDKEPWHFLSLWL
jgi:hypothetical protein